MLLGVPLLGKSRATESGTPKSREGGTNDENRKTSNDGPQIIGNGNRGHKPGGSDGPAKNNASDGGQHCVKPGNREGKGVGEGPKPNGGGASN